MRNCNRAVNVLLLTLHNIICTHCNSHLLLCCRWRNWRADWRFEWRQNFIRICKGHWSEHQPSEIRFHQLGNVDCFILHDYCSYSWQSGTTNTIIADI